MPAYRIHHAGKGKPLSYLDGKAVQIVGASSGLGAFLARELVARGCRVGLLARRDDKLKALADELGDAAAWVRADVTQTGQLHAALDLLDKELGGTDIVVTNAGFGRPEPPHKFQAGRSEDMYTVNLLGMVRVLDWALPKFLDAGAGHIVGVASVASYMGLPNTASYCGSKAAMRVHLQSLRVSLRRRGIRVTTICPGYVESELTAKNNFPMPFLWKTDRAARVMADVIEKRRGEVVFPWQMKVIFALMTRLPLALTERWMTRAAPG